MTLNMEISKQALKFIKMLPPKQYKQVVGTLLSLLSNPEPHDSKPLKGDQRQNRRADIGEYRIIYRVEGEALKVPIVGKRNDDEVYKLLGRRSGH